jgi:hypothetical protein
MNDVNLQKDGPAPRTYPSPAVPPRDTTDQHQDAAHEPAINSGQARTPDRAKTKFSFEK